MKAIERLTGQPVERVHVPGFSAAPAMAQTASKAFASVRHRAAVGRRSFRPRRSR